jgi:glucoamylase
MSALNETYRWLDDDGPAFGGPGLQPRWTSSKKDAVATAYAASSRIWFTASHGTLNEIYYPTIDRPQTRDMELLFTDEETFFHEEKRDFEYDFHYIDDNALAVRVIANDLGGRYTVTKEFITDPHHPVVLMNVKIEGDEAILSRLKCYALLAPHLDGGGAGNSARSVDIAGQRCVLAWKNNVSLAFGADCGFSRSSCGFVGSSDGYQDLSTHMKMNWHFGQALDGNIALTGEIDVAKNREFTIAIALGDGHHSAVAGMMQTLSTPYSEHRDRFIKQWHRALPPPGLENVSTDGGRLMRVSHAVILTHEDKTYSGAFIASASIPWGASKGDDDLGGYHLVWTRDMVQSATAMLACGRIETARRALVCLHTASRRRLRAELLDRRNPLLVGHSARRSGLPDHARLAAVEGRRPGQLRYHPLRRRGRDLSGALCPGDAAGALGGERRLFAFNAGCRDLRADLRGRPLPRTR